MNSKLLVSVVVIGLIAVAIGGHKTGSFFSDTETSTGNSFTAAAVFPSTSVCGNGIVESSEICDNNQQSCTIDGHTGTQACNANCLGWGECTLPVICTAKPDVILVIDKASDINSTDMNLLKTAAHAFVAALYPQTNGAHIGQVSFATYGYLDSHLTDSKTAIDVAIDTLSPSANNSRNLYEGLLYANQDLANPFYVRSGSPHYIIVITHGDPDAPGNQGLAKQSAKDQADAADTAGTKIYVIDIEPGGSSWLAPNIATDASHYIAAGNFSQVQTSLLGIATAICN